jgi:hypothetical protein
MLENLFPANPHKRVFSEIYVRYRGSRLFFDFFVKELSLYVEVQGRQHTNFVKHFHGDKETFQQQKYRDNLKRIWAEENEVCLIRFNYDEDITEELVLKKINIGLEEGFYE